jgi:uncharacterized Fe-S cluster-containing protein
MAIKVMASFVRSGVDTIGPLGCGQRPYVRSLEMAEVMNRKLQLLRDIKHMTAGSSSRPIRTEEEVKVDNQKLEVIRTWVAELEGYEQTMVKGLAPYLPEETCSHQLPV